MLIFSDHNAMKLEINHKNTEKTCKDMEAVNHIIKQWMGQQQDQRGNQKIPETKENWDTTIQNL